MRLALMFPLILSLAAAEDPVDEFTVANNLFAEGFYKHLSDRRKGNFLVSPFSAETILAFAYSGSRGPSAQELRKALHLPKDKNKVETAIQTLVRKFQCNGFLTLQTANKLYLKKNFTVRDEFKEAGKLVYGAETENIDFVPNTSQTARTINRWVEQKTNNKIKNLVNAGDFDEYTKAVFINALYFNASWSDPFPSENTKKERFYINSEKVVKADTMHHYKTHLNYFECPYLEVQMLELPFKDDEASMIIVLPFAKEGLSSLDNKLDKIFSRKYWLTTKLMNVALPKFRIETSSDLKKILQMVGVTSVFGEGTADLSGIAGKPGDLYITKVAQNTYINVCEDGVEAAAATSVAVYGTKAILETTDFIADHPFLFYIIVKDIVIFAGRVTDPSHF